MESSLLFTASPYSPDFKGVPGEYKVVHLIRHAQGTHNLAVLNAGGVDGGLTEEEYKNWAWHDARLTAFGEAQARSLAPVISKQRIDVVLVSSLSRAIQTARIAIGDAAPYVVEDSVRERIGAHPCDKRRSKTAMAVDFPWLDLSTLATEEDDKWTEAREPMEDLIARANNFCNIIKNRPEDYIAVTTHNDFLTTLLFESDLQLSDPSLRRKFANAESMSIVLTWQDPESSPRGGSSVSASTSSYE